MVFYPFKCTLNPNFVDFLAQPIQKIYFFLCNCTARSATESSQLAEIFPFYVQLAPLKTMNKRIKIYETYTISYSPFDASTIQISRESNVPNRFYWAPCKGPPKLVRFYTIVLYNWWQFEFQHQNTFENILFPSISHSQPRNVKNLAQSSEFIIILA